MLRRLLLYCRDAILHYYLSYQKGARHLCVSLTLTKWVAARMIKIKQVDFAFNRLFLV